MYFSKDVMDKRKKILVICRSPENLVPSQRFRIELYKKLLEQNGFDVTYRNFLDSKGHEIAYKFGGWYKKIIAILKGLIRRGLLVFEIRNYDYVFLLKAAAPLGPPILEWIYSKVMRAKIIYDFDDAIWIPHVSDQNRVPDFLKTTNKVKHICNWAYKVSCGNEYLCAYARQYNANVIYNPTCVDTDRQHNIIVNHLVERVTIGWTGSFSTLKYLDSIKPILKALQLKYDFDMKIICNRPPQLELNNVVYVEWTEENEITELASCQIGLMPLPDDEWAKGKCGFKLIQYMALGMPAVCSPAGVNKIIVENGVSGFICHTDDDWYNAIEQLLLDAALRQRMGQIGRKKIEDEYSLRSNSANFLSLFS
jgi:glycosyltransferase involved in cell wall biosynthesis